MTKKQMILRGLTDNELVAAQLQLREDLLKTKDAARRAKIERIMEAITGEQLRRQG